MQHFDSTTLINKCIKHQTVDLFNSCVNLLHINMRSRHSIVPACHCQFYPQTEVNRLKSSHFTSPKVLCTAIMELRQVLRMLLLANTLGFTMSCGGGGGPKPCSWTTCRLEWRNDWGPGISTGRCVYQQRNAHHITSSHSGSGSCPASTHCSPSTQSRTMCE